ncbi:gamma-glutamyltransferase [Roseibium sp. MMSF_3412]|uniref:gamma-glutamyltransferase n=1 Tax=Roseibium sp. MMSF_3412 TaxID=3046712 RepID=UPI00273FC3E1|nr:gamma-glutamyltransferase [Roseibium sp. MMSF_3412]
MSRPLPFTCEKQPASGSIGMVVTNHPLGSAAGTEMLSAGGNAIDAAVSALLTLTVVEPMMVGIAGGGLSHVRLRDGTHVVMDALSCAAKSMHAGIYEPVSDIPPNHMEVKDRRNTVGPSAVAVPGNLAGWCRLHEKYGKLPFADLVDPAIRAASRGFLATHYLSGAVNEFRQDLGDDPECARVLMPEGRPPRFGERIFMHDYAESLRLIAKEGVAALHGGALGAALADRLATGGPDCGWVTLDDLRNYRPVERDVIAGTYRGYEIIGPPPPASSGVHIVQMLNILESYEVSALGFGSVEGLDLLARTIALAFDDRRAASGDPDFVDVPVERLTSKDYAADCLKRLGSNTHTAHQTESADTTHVTIADREGNIVTATHTINGLFGARFMVPGTGIIPNNYMMNYDPHPGRALSIEPGKRVPTSMAPMIVSKDGTPCFALGLPGGLRIFPSAMQAIVNLIDHGMSLQEAVEAPRIWTQGQEVEIEKPFAPAADALAQNGHDVKVVPHIGGGMNAIGFEQDRLTGAACWRADGTAMGIGGGLARPGVRFWPDKAPDEDDSETKTANEAKQ